MAPEPLRFDPIEEAQRNWDARGWEKYAPGMAAITSIMRAEAIFLSRTEDVLRRYDLTFARYEVLMLLLFSREGRLPLNKIGQRLQVHGSSVTNAIDRLEAQAFVRRTPNPRDGRGILAELTTAGREVALQATEEVNSQVFADVGLSGRELSSLLDLLRRIRHDAGDFT